MKRVVVLVVLCLISTGAFALSTRTYVSNSGTDTGACNPTPCRTFSYAIGQTSAGGEVLAIDSSFYGSFTINKAINITAPPGVTAGVFVPGSGSGVAISAGASDIVRLNGLHITTTNATTVGISVGLCKRVEITNTDISNTTTGIDISSDVSVFTQHVRISQTTTGIWSRGTTSPASNMRIFLVGTVIVGATTGVKAQGGTVMMNYLTGSGIVFATTPWDISNMSGCTQLAIGSFTGFVGAPTGGGGGDYTTCGAP